MAFLDKLKKKLFNSINDNRRKTNNNKKKEISVFST